MTGFVDPATLAHQSQRLMIGISGPSGGGKTLSALRVATGLAAGGPIAFIDTENGRGLFYKDDFTFLYRALAEPYAPEAYWEAIQDAVSNVQPAVIVIDSFS